MKKTIIEFLTFSSIGILNTAIHITVLYILTEYIGIYYLIASFIGFLIAVTNSFIFNTIWTFKRKISEHTSTRYTKFFVISALAATINILLLYTITEIGNIWYLWSQIIATGGSLAVNFIGNKLWTYK